jgi:3D (Asp-Asp-Asp) domain-containing protein
MSLFAKKVLKLSLLTTCVSALLIPTFLDHTKNFQKEDQSNSSPKSLAQILEEEGWERPKIIPQKQIDLKKSIPLKQIELKKASREVDAIVTSYCPCSICCEGWSGAGKTSRGRDARKTRGVAVDPKAIPYGSMVTIPGYGKFLADDTGGAMRQDWKKGIVHIDLRYHNHKEALRFGVKKMKILIE